MNLFRDLQNPRWMYLKAVLFLVAGMVAGGVLLFENSLWRNAFLLLVCVWSFCRLYYFAFYVIEKYIDASFKFAGLGSVLRYWLNKRAM
jgi:hypothetical protein